MKKAASVAVFLLLFLSAFIMPSYCEEKPAENPAPAVKAVTATNDRTRTNGKILFLFIMISTQAGKLQRRIKQKHGVIAQIAPP